MGVSGMDQHVDVLVATRDRPQDLHRMLRTAVAQTYRTFTMLIVDQSDDVVANQHVIAQIGDRRIRHVPQDARGKSRALNAALRLSCSELVAFTDDDCELPADWLQELVRSARAHPLAALVFGTVAAGEHEPADYFIPTVQFQAVQVLAAGSLPPRGLIGMGANMLARRSAVEDVGMFDEELGPGGLFKTGEEVELAYRALRVGFDVVQDPRPTVVHWGARPWSGGAASEVINVAFFAIASGYGKNVRAGDRRAMRAFMRELSAAVIAVTRAVRDLHGPYHLRRLHRTLLGFLAGFRRGPAVPPWPRDTAE